MDILVHESDYRVFYATILDPKVLVSIFSAWLVEDSSAISFLSGPAVFVDGEAKEKTLSTATKLTSNDKRPTTKAAMATGSTSSSSSSLLPAPNKSPRDESGSPPPP